VNRFQGESFESRRLVIEHEQGAIEKLDFVVPENMENSRLGCGRVMHEAGVGEKNSLYSGGGIPFLGVPN
jgi:hypothetical protein